MKKYELTNETIKINRKNLYRIRALRDFGTVKKGDLGGFIQSERNLSHGGNAWVYDNAWVFDNARVTGNARVFDYARISNNANVSGNAAVSGNAWVSDSAKVSGNANISFKLVTFNFEAYVCSIQKDVNNKIFVQAGCKQLFSFKDIKNALIERGFSEDKVKLAITLVKTYLKLFKMEVK